MRNSLPGDVRWVDHSNLGAVDLIAPPGARKEQSWQQLFWNTSVKRLLLLGSAPIDQFDTKRLQVAADGRLLVDGRPERRPLLVQTFASTVQLTGEKRVRHELIFDLYRPTGTPRLRLLAAGRFADRWLAPVGAITVWTKEGGGLELVLTLPKQTQITPIHFTAKGVDRTIRVHPGQRIPLHFKVPAGGAWSLHFSSARPGFLGDRGVSVIAERVAFDEGMTHRERDGRNLVDAKPQ